MANATHVIGLESDELPAVRSLVALLRHSDPKIAELTRQALYYLEEIAAMGIEPGAGRMDTPA